MSIRISNTSIHFGNFTLTSNTEGFSFDGKIRAKRQFVDSRTSGGFGTIAGYTTGRSTTIDKFPFSVDNNATDVGDLSQGRQQLAAQSSPTHGYSSGGYSGSSPPPTKRSVNIDKFPFSVDTNATDVGDITASGGHQGATGQSSLIEGYTSGGYTSPGVYHNIIDKFPFATDTNASDVGDLTVGRYAISGQSSRTHGYTSGGQISGTSNVIDKFSFVTNSNASDVGNLINSLKGPMGNSSEVNGFVSGGNDGSNRIANIQKFPFATDTNAVNTGDLTQSRVNGAGQSSDVNGYTSGGDIPAEVVTIDKFDFSINNNATDVGDLTQARKFVAGQQV